MPIITPSSREVLELEGLHLYHYETSNCSQKVRICLAEKGLPWVSHPIDLGRSENASPEYLRINPKGLVPALVHDGVVVTESSDILDYLDSRLPGPSLVPAAPAEAARMRQWIALQDSIQWAVKVLSHEFLFKLNGRKSSRALERLEKGQVDPQLLAFHRRFASPEGLSRTEIREAILAVRQALTDLEARLSSADWLAGEAHSLADIAWLVNLHRFSRMDFPLEQYPGVSRWFERLQARSSYQEMILGFEPEPLRQFFQAYVDMRRAEGTDVRAEHWLEEE